MTDDKGREPVPVFHRQKFSTEVFREEFTVAPSASHRGHSAELTAVLRAAAEWLDANDVEVIAVQYELTENGEPYITLYHEQMTYEEAFDLHDRAERLLAKGPPLSAADAQDHALATLILRNPLRTEDHDRPECGCAGCLAYEVHWAGVADRARRRREAEQ